MEDNKYPVFSKKIADALIVRGFKLVDTAINRKYKHLKVFYFEFGKEFELAFLEEQVISKNSKLKLIDK
jgi:hypothetical protein